MGSRRRLTTAQLVERADALAARGGRAILGVTGPPGSGKSTLARAVADALGPGRAAVAGMDGFHLSNDVLVSLGRRERKGAIDTFDDAGYTTLIERLAAQAPGDGVVYAPVFRREIEEPIAAGVGVRATTPLVVTEGNYLLARAGAWPRARARMAEVWYLDPPQDLRLERLVRRHAAFGKSPEAARAWALGTDQANAELIARTRGDADLIVDWR
ncbi:nucleoside/nucleotide kinase family protein [Xylanimonas ulmi]|uniref:ATPase family protein associated with various cellular activities (AAA) n=1 Tax=Xylanimonas ulmi TaxID=228973 RepID=A0A4V2EXW9_9MICO|nr:nucleoside/nucleotide kinase family protein [Xylanibacterium ulmi]RZS60950.1 ATPase family protein associated with various cellular activities (AAA) [Xylanibacterium ulmi]